MKLKREIGLTLIGLMISTNAMAIADNSTDKPLIQPVLINSIETTNTKVTTDIPLDSYEGLHFVLVVNGKGIDPKDTKVYINEKDNIMIPLRVVSEALGYDVKWNNEAKLAELIRKAQYITVKPGEDYYTFSKMAPIELGVASEIKENRTYVPINFIKDVLRLDYFMDETGVINIKDESTLVEKKSEFGIQGEIKSITKLDDNTRILVEGKSFDEGYSDSIIFNISENTEIINPLNNEIVSIDDLKEGDTINTFYNGVLTRSIPPQGNAEKIEILKNVAFKSGTITEINKNEKYTQILIGDRMSGIMLNINNDTKIVTDENEVLRIEDLKVGMEIHAYHDLIMTMSLPPISNAQKIVVK